MFPKPKRYKNKTYFNFVRTLPDIVTGVEAVPGVLDIIPHHILTGGMGTKCSDLLTIPVTDTNHRLIEKKELFYQDGSEVDLYKEIRKCMEAFLDKYFPLDRQCEVICNAYPLNPLTFSMSEDEYFVKEIQDYMENELMPEGKL